MEVRMKELKYGKAAGKEEVTGEIIKNGGEMVMYWI